MFRILGFLVALLIGGFLSHYWWPKAWTEPLYQWLDEGIETVTSIGEPIVEQAKTQLEERVYSVDTSAITPETTIKREASVVDEAVPVESLPPEPYVEELEALSSEPRSLAVWAPFNTEMSAKGFADYLGELTGFSFAVKVLDDQYQIVFDYTAPAQLDALHSQLKQLMLQSDNSGIAP